jgi:hypothetical protein
VFELTRLGLTPENWQSEVDLLMSNAGRNNIFHPTKQGDVFLPLYGMFFDDYLIVR